MKAPDQYKVIIVDDEKKALERLERILSEEETLSLLASFTNPNEAIDYISTQEVDVAFVDIEMPEINGLELAEMIAERNPGIDVVFVTAYSQYALQAFQVHAVGYLLKPIEIEDIRKQMNILRKRRELRLHGRKKGTCSIQCLGHFLFYQKDDQFVNWRTAKSEELLGFLIHHRGKPVSKEKIMDTLWPEMNAEKASQNLHSNLYYLREILKANGVENLLERNRDNYRLNLEYIDCDMLHFMDLIEELSKAGDRVTIETLEKADGLYRGAYFEDKNYEWATNRRPWLQDQFIRIKLKQVAIYQAKGEKQKAIDGYKTMIQHNSTLEEAYIELAKLYAEQNDIASAVHWYKACEKVLKEELDVDPSAGFRAFMAKVK